jgi:hypothetical protein
MVIDSRKTLQAVAVGLKWNPRATIETMKECQVDEVERVDVRGLDAGDRCTTCLQNLVLCSPSGSKGCYEDRSTRTGRQADSARGLFPDRRFLKGTAMWPLHSSKRSAVMSMDVPEYVRGSTPVSLVIRFRRK